MSKYKIILISSFFLSVIIFTTSCQTRTKYESDFKTSATPEPTPTATPYIAPTYTAMDGLDLEAVGAMAKTVKNAAELEKKLNERKGINNLDLDKDGKVDYISVYEYKSKDEKMRGYSLAVKFDKKSVQEIATIILEREGPQAKIINVAVKGNEQIYGEDYYYEGEWASEEAMFDDWAYSEHNYYESPYYYDYYPGGYDFYYTDNWFNYRRRTDDWRRNSNFKKTDQVTHKTVIVSPNAGKTTANIKAKLKNPTKAQEKYRTKTDKASTTTTTTAKRDKKATTKTPPTPYSSSTTYPSSTPYRGGSTYPSSTPYRGTSSYPSSTPRSSSSDSTSYKSSSSSSSSSKSSKSRTTTRSRRRP